MYEGVLPPTKKQQNLLKTKVLEAESSFASHCRSFESQIRELNQQFNVVKDKVTELHKDITAIRKAQTPPLVNRYELLTRECTILESSLDRQQQELDRMATVFEVAWEEQLWRIRVEQEVFSCQRADVMTLRNELKHLSNVAEQLEPYIRSLTPAQTDQASEQALNFQSLLEHIGRMNQTEQKIPRSRSRVLGQLFDKVRPSSSVGHHERERSKSAGQSDKPMGQKAKKPPNMERLESQIKEKLQDIVGRRQNQQLSKSDTETERKLSKTDLEQIAKLGSKKIMYKKIGKSCDRINSCSKLEISKKNDAEYQRIPDTTKALVHTEVRSTPGSPKCKNKPKLTPKHRKPKVYPYSDGEDNVFYSVNDSADSMSTSSRRSSFESPDKTLVVVINRRNKNLTLAQKQRSWETFPPKRKHHVCQKLSAPTPMPLRKTDSFEGHEEAVKSLVAAVQETRRKPKSN